MMDVRQSGSGPIQTLMNAPGNPRQTRVLHLVGRLGQVSDIVHGILFLESSPFITGEILHVDGGQSAGH
jgi:NAD(P)-dependent dehydrogenase (short-subunit alcohol dehydrogenase family)